MRIKFLEAVTVQDREARHYPKGCVAELSEDACRHWVVRKKAVFCDAPPKKISYTEEREIAEFIRAADAVSKKRRKRKG